MKGKVLLLFVTLLVSTVALATPCKHTHKEYWGYVGGPNNSQTFCTAQVSPWTPPDTLVGEEDWDCDGNYTSWGIVCDTVVTTIENCGGCQPHEATVAEKAPKKEAQPAPKKADK